MGKSPTVPFPVCTSSSSCTFEHFVYVSSLMKLKFTPNFAAFFTLPFLSALQRFIITGNLMSEQPITVRRSLFKSQNPRLA